MGLSKENILRATDKGLSVFRHYLSIPFQVGKNFRNPLYEDKNASCNVFFDRKNDCYRMKDFGNDGYSGDCFALVGLLMGLDCQQPNEFTQLMEKINNELQLGLRGKVSSQQAANYLSAKQPDPTASFKQARSYQITRKKFTTTELSWWRQYGVTESILESFHAASLSRFGSENKEKKPYQFLSSEQEPMYGYAGKQHIKVYRPMSVIRFLQAGIIPEHFCFGLEQLPAKGDLLFITGGEKDVMALAAHGFFAICFNSETSHIPKSVIFNLSFRFKHIVLLYDMDKTGIDSSGKHEQQLSEYGVKRLLLPLSGAVMEKDIADYFKMGNGGKNLLKLFVDFLDTTYQNTMTMLKPCEVDYSHPPEQASAIVSAGDVPLGTQGNLFCITGGEGTGKSSYVAAIIAGSIGESAYMKVDTLGLAVRYNEKQQAILLYDTEQSELQLYKNTSTLLRRAKVGEKPEEFRAFSLSPLSRKERLKAIVNSMDKFYFQYGGIHLAVIDGIADLVSSANDEAESLQLVDELSRLAGIYNTCIICVLHFIPSGLKLRGHLGSEVNRKASGIVSIELDSDPSMSIVKALKVRDGGSALDVPLMQFTWDKEVGMHVYAGEKPKEVKEKRKEVELVNVAKDMFRQKPLVTYTELCGQIQALLDVKERTAKSYIKFMKERGIIKRDSCEQNHFSIGII